MDAATRVKTLDSAIASLQKLRSALVGESIAEAPPYELHGRHINAPVWPWLAAGWLLGALFVLLFLVAWTYWGT